MPKGKNKFYKSNIAIVCSVCQVYFKSNDEKRISQMLDKHYLLKHNIKKEERQTITKFNYKPEKIPVLPNDRLKKTKDTLQERKELYKIIENIKNKKIKKIKIEEEIKK